MAKPLRIAISYVHYIIGLSTEKMGLARFFCYVGILYGIVVVALWDPKKYSYK